MRLAAPERPERPLELVTLGLLPEELRRLRRLEDVGVAIVYEI